MATNGRRIGRLGGRMARHGRRIGRSGPRIARNRCSTPTFAQGITPSDRPIATHASESGTRYVPRLALRLAHRSVRVGHDLERVGHGWQRGTRWSPFVSVECEDFAHPDTEAAMRFEPRAPSSLLLPHADLFVAMSDAI